MEWNSSNSSSQSDTGSATAPADLHARKTESTNMTASSAVEPGEFFLFMGSFEPVPERGFDMTNLDELVAEPNFCLRPYGGGFPVMNGRPRIVIDPSIGYAPRDFEQNVSGYWMVSGRLHSVLTEYAASSFEFVECDVVDLGGVSDARYFLCELTKEIDALDESNSILRIIVSDDYALGKFYSFRNGNRLFFHKDRIGSVHAFRFPYQAIEMGIFDVILRDAIIKAGANSGILFKDMSDWSKY